MPAAQKEESRPSSITRDTVIPLSLALGMIITIISGYTWLSDRFHALDVKLIKLETKIGEPAKRIHRMDLNAWVAMLKASNPDMKVPDFPVR